MAIETKREGRRTYILGTVYAQRPQCKAAGATWDPDRRAWWMGDDSKARALAEQLATAPETAEPEGLKDSDELYGRGLHKGKSCLVVWIGPTKKGLSAKLASMDGSRIWWAPASEVEVKKAYPVDGALRGRTSGPGRRRGLTWGRLKKLRERHAHDRIVEAHGGVCRGCGGPVRDAGHHRAMEGYCGTCAFDEFDC